MILRDPYDEEFVDAHDWCRCPIDCPNCPGCDCCNCQEDHEEDEP